MKLFDANFDVIRKAMDLRIKRHALLSSNVANSETPNFRARELDFSGELEKVLGQSKDGLAQTNSRHMDITANGQAHVVYDRVGAVGADGNNVDLDLQMGRLSENSRSYQNAVNLIGVQLRLLKTAARGRSGF